MYKKTLLSLAVASSITLTGCIGTESGDDEVAVDPSLPGAGFNPAGSTWPLFDPAAGALPIPNDLIFDSEQGDGTFGVDDTSPPVTTALNELSGASTVAPTVIQFNGSLDPATVKGTVDQDGTDVNPALQTVFLIELDYASGDPVQGLGNREASTVPVTANQLRYRADVETLTTEAGSADAIRVLPLEPLDPGKRYVVVVTNEVTASGDAIIPSFVYDFLTDESNELDGSLGTVQSLINNLWEASAVGYFNGFVNPARAEALTAGNIAISYSFTTSKDEKVLQYIAEPAAWFSDQITSFLRVSATKKLTGAALFFANQQGADNALPAEDWDLNDDGVVNALDFDRNGDGIIVPTDDFLIGANPQDGFGHNDLLVAADAAEDGFPTTLPPNPDSPLNALFGPSGPCTLPAEGLPPENVDVSLGSDAVDCVAVALASQFRSELPTPLPGVNRNVSAGGGEFTNSITIDDSSIKPVGLVSAVASNIPVTTSVLAAEGTISLPYYLGDTAAGIAGANALNWVADNELAASLNQTFSALGVTLPQADPSVSTAVNYIFPFPKQRSTEEVPMLALYPSTGSIKGVVLYQHGITTDRSSALTFGTGLAGQGYVVVAIDQPLHGVAPFSLAEQLGLTINLLTKGNLTDEELEAITPLVAVELAAETPDPSGINAALNDAENAGDIQITAEQLLGLIPLVLEGGEENIATIAAASPDLDANSARSLVNTVANAGSTIPGLAPDIGSERHFGLYATATGQPEAMVFEPANAEGTDGSGSFYINLQNFLTARDNNRQSAVDQMNLRATLFGNPAAAKAGLTLERPTEVGGSGTPVAVTAATPAYFAGHSLGTLTGIPFVASVNKDDIAETIFTAEDGSTSLPTTFNNIQSASMLTPGGGIVRLLENSPAFAPRILFGLAQSGGGQGPTQGSAALEAFFNVAQTALDAADPVNFAASMHASTPVLLSEVSGDNVIPNAADQAEWGIPALSGTFPPEVTELPVTVTVDSFPAPLSGTRPLTLGLTDGINSSFFTSYNDGDHGTPTSASPATVFGQMLCGTLVTYDAAATCDFLTP
ncbi:hypothetical protein [Marinobacter halotolerans]|uniref:hypothetical protein n=1 Tax=Marinobacter halotolerans TaxID=1569211 RepID=UPI00124872BB|nr:hypothetical protein [Marinobacter halotolerans]